MEENLEGGLECAEGSSSERHSSYGKRREGGRRGGAGRKRGEEEGVGAGGGGRGERREEEGVGGGGGDEEGNREGCKWKEGVKTRRMAARESWEELERVRRGQGRENVNEKRNG